MTQLIENIDYEKSFFGSQSGVLLINRGINDNHICFLIIAEDDGNWFTSENSMSTFWLSDLKQVLCEVEVWLNAFATKTKWGWEFKE